MSGAGGTVGVRADFGTGVGLGHLVRSAALARAMRAIGWRGVLLTSSEAALPPAAAAAFDLRLSADAAVPPLDWLVLDDPHVPPDARARLTGAARRTLVLRDGDGAEGEGADLVLDPNLPAADRAADDRTLLGPTHALLRPAFAAARGRARAAAERAGVHRVLIAPGATDVHGVCPRLVPALAAAGYAVDIALARLARGFGAAADAADAAGAAVRLCADADDAAMADLILGADVVVGNAGGSSWERCTLGAPAVVLAMAEDQRGNVAALSAMGAAIDAGHAADATMPARVLDALAGLGRDPARLAHLSEAAFGICDGLGAFRVAARLAPLTTRSGAEVRLRPVRDDDCERLYDWQRQPHTRRHARSPRVPSRDEHRDWFARTRRDHACVFSVVEHAGRPAGVVRLDLRAGDVPRYEVSIHLAAEHLGQGVARPALAAAARLVPFAELVAHVLPGNDTSLRLFEAAGYERQANVYVLAPRPV